MRNNKSSRFIVQSGKKKDYRKGAGNRSLTTTLISLGKILTSVVLVGLLLNKVGTNNLITQIRSANLMWLLVGLAVFTLSNLIGSFQWGLLLRDRGIDLRLRQIISFYFVGLFFNNFLIGYVGGDAFRIYDVRKISGNTSSTVSAVFFDRFVGFLVLTTMGLIASFITVNLLANGSVFYAAGVVFIGWIFALVFFFKQGFAKKFSWLFKLILPKVIRAKMLEVYLGINAYRHNRRLLLKILALSTITQSFRIATHYFAALAVGVQAPIVYFWVFVPVIALAASMPISVGGIGIREQSGVLMFSRMGLNAANVAAFEFLAYIIGVLASIPGGLIFVLRKGSEKSHSVNNSLHSKQGNIKESQIQNLS